MGKRLLLAMSNASQNALVAIVFLFIMLPPSEWRSMDAKHLHLYPVLGYWEGALNEESLWAQLLCAFAYAVFGGIHCIAWNFAYLSLLVRNLWRVASVEVAAIPLIFPVLFWLLKRHPISLTPFMTTFITIPCIVFISARVVLLILPFLELRYLPADSNVLKTVSWDRFVPHIG
jgi:hypothetical protein